MKTEMNIRIPEIVINPELNKLRELNLFQEKMEKANAFIKEHGVAKFKGRK
jgi:hypothetical protein